MPNLLHLAAAATPPPCSPTHRRPAAAVAAAALVALPLLAGCGGGPGAGAAQPVASLPSSPGPHRSAGSAGTASAAGTSRTGLGPTLPDNASPAEVKRVYNPWMLCLEAHGDHAVGTKGKDLLAPSGPIPSAAGKACRSLQPRPPWQETPADNPHYNRDAARWVNCLNARGVHVTAVPGGWNYDDQAQADTPRTGQIVTSCEMRAFGEH